MTNTMKRVITKEQFDRAMTNHGYLTQDDKETVFSMSERCGYGVYDSSVIQDGDKYYVRFQMGSSCD